MERTESEMKVFAPRTMQGFLNLQHSWAMDRLRVHARRRRRWLRGMGWGRQAGRFLSGVGIGMALDLLLRRG